MNFSIQTPMNAECRVRNPEFLRRPAPRAPRSTRGFTMIEIAISLAIIGFALVAIIGILPTSMQTQKDNRQETVVNQDATMLLDGIRNGAQGLDDLTNYVAAISIVQSIYGATGRANGSVLASNWYGYASSTAPVLLTNGFHIIGLLSTPKYIAMYPQRPPAPTYLSNHVVAYMRSMSGPASEKAPASYTSGERPQQAVQDLAFSLGFNYRLIVDVVPYFGYNTNGVAYSAGVPAGAPGGGPEYSGFSENLKANLHEVRLNFRWPLQSDGSAGPGYQVFRTAAAGALIWTNEAYPDSSWPALMTTNLPNTWPTALFFFQPRTYLQVQTP